MKSVIAFLLLITISCQIGRGDCVFDTIYEDMKEFASDSMQYAKDTYQKYMPDLPDMPSVSVPDSVKAGYNNFKDSMVDMTKGAEEIAKDSMDSIAKATDYV